VLGCQDNRLDADEDERDHDEPESDARRSCLAGIALSFSAD
jgi:hypothetical protein